MKIFDPEINLWQEQFGEAYVVMKMAAQRAVSPTKIGTCSRQ
jgi:hypothetical protein